VRVARMVVMVMARVIVSGVAVVVLAANHNTHPQNQREAEQALDRRVTHGSDPYI
jgi:hypothetical protein